MRKQEIYKAGDRQAHILLYRHGQPTTYSDTHSALSSEGREQVEAAATRFTNTLVHTQDRPALIQPFYSGRLRTKESATIFYEAVKDMVDTNHLAQYEILPPRRSALMQTADALNPVIDSGIPKEVAYAYWMTSPEETLKKLGSATPRETRRRIDRIIEETDKYRNTTTGPDLYLVGLTHETTLGAVLQPFVPVEEYPQVPYAEVVQIDLMKEGVHYQLPKLHLAHRRS